VGVAAYPIAEGTLSEAGAMQYMGIGFKWGTAHNSFVQIGAELGVFGLLAFCLALFQAFHASWREGRSPPGRARNDGEVLGQVLAGMLIGFIVCGFFLSQAYGAFTFTLYGLIIGLAKLTAAERKQGSARSVARPHRRRGIAASPVPAIAAGPAPAQGWLTP
jgi:O-antigen ligase